jgi:hypothetical protein
MINYTVTISNLYARNEDDAENVVKFVDWIYTATDDVSNNSVFENKTTALGPKDLNDFVDYANVTPELVTTWLQENTDFTRLQEYLSNQLIAPVSTPLPWN